MRVQLAVPVIVSILILGLIGFSQDAEASSMTFTTDTTISSNEVISGGETWTINPGVTLTINPGVTVNADNGNINNFGTIINDGDLVKNQLGNINNLGIIINNSGGLIALFNGGITNNFGTIINNSGGTIRNFAGAIANFGTIENTGTIENQVTGIIINNSGGRITNNLGGIIDNSGSTIDNTGLIINFGTIENTGTIINNLGGTIANGATFVNDCGGIIIGTISGNPVVDICMNAPDAVTDLALSVISSTQVDLQWSEPFDGGPPILSYKIIRKLNGAGPEPLTTVLAPQTSHSDTTLSPGDTGTYGVIAVNNVGRGLISNIPAPVTTELNVIEQILNSISQLIADLSQEVTDRIAGDTDLQNQIDVLSSKPSITPISIVGVTTSITTLTWAGHAAAITDPADIPVNSLLFSSSGTISNFFVKLDPKFGPPGLGESITVTILLNGAIPSLSCTVVDENFDCSNAVDSFDVIPEDSIILEISRSSSATVTNVNTSFIFTSG